MQQGILNPKYDILIQDATERFLKGYDWRLYKAQLWKESNFNPEAVSPVGARGIAQFMLDTWKEWSKKAGFDGAPIDDPKASIFTGACYLNWLIGQWSRPRPDIDRHCLALASYNAGLGNILKAQKAAGDPAGYAEISQALHLITGPYSRETLNYVERIMGHYVDLVLTPRQSLDSYME